MKHTKQKYLSCDLFNDRDLDIRLLSRKLVHVRKKVKCLSFTKDKMHFIEPGELALFEKAIVEGKWGSCYICINCLDDFIENFIGTT